MEPIASPGVEAAPPGLWRFGQCVLDERVASLRVAGVHVDLDRSSYDVLLALLRQAGAVVTKDELLESGWPGRVVSENSLSKAVGRLRAALGVDGKGLRAVHGYGYRLAVEVACDPVAADAVQVDACDPLHLHVGDRLPQRPGWRLQRRLGEGSAGVIFLARSEQGEERAVKLATSEAGLRSLRREIALSRHLRAAGTELPWIAPVLGWNLQHPPFFLELPHYPDGNLRDWAQARGGLHTVSLAQRLALCVQLCQAVASLHAIGVIHRDLKPENLFVVADGSPSAWRILLADLGAAEGVQPPADLPGAVRGGAAARSPDNGSLLYVAPELIAGRAPTQDSDVFALGVLVYQLLAVDLCASLAPGWEAALDEPLLREDVAAAAAVDPCDRIDARALATRLAQLPERCARRDAEAARRREDEARRRQLATTRSRRRLSAVVSVALGVGLVSTSLMYFAAERQRRVAEDSAAQRQAMLTFLTRDLLGQADPYRGGAGGPQLALAEAIDRAAARTGAALVEDPAAAAAVHAMLGTVYLGQDRHERAVDELRKARGLYRKLGDAHVAALVKVETALCDAYRISDRLAEAEPACLSAVRHARASGSELAHATLKLGQLRGEQGRYRDSLEILRPLLREGGLAGDRRALGELHWALGLATRAQGQYAQARDHFSALLAIAQEPGRAQSWRGWAYNSLGSVLVELGDYARADAMLLAARDVFVRAQGADQVEAQMPQAWRADIRLRRGEWREARTLLDGMLRAWDGRLKPGHPLRLRAESSLAWAEAMSGAQASAARRLAAAWQDRATQFDRPDDRTVATRTLRWIHVALALEDQASAGRLLALFDQRLRGALPDAHPLSAEVDCLHAEWALRDGRQALARARAVACHERLRAALPPAHPLLDAAARLLAGVRAGDVDATLRMASLR